MKLFAEEPPTDWIIEGACRGSDLSLFFPDRGDEGAPTAEARAVCAVCPVQPECLHYAVSQNIVHGFWGGLTPKQRRRARRTWLKERRSA